jgi:hypothetical protein
VLSDRDLPAAIQRELLRRMTINVDDGGRRDDRRIPTSPKPRRSCSATFGCLPVAEG